MTKVRPLEERFNRLVDKTSGACWLWLGNKLHGYGRMRFGRGHQRAHRIAYELFVGHIPTGLFVCHRCDVTACVNPAHLFLGTNAENTADKCQKGRAARGAKLPHSRLHAHVGDIIRRSAAGEPQRAIADSLGVTQRAVWRVLREANR